MSHGIAIVGANGSGKTTLGRYLAGSLGLKHMDIEAYCFEDSAVPYANSHSRKEVQARLLADIKRHGQFILSAVNCDFGDTINSMYEFVLYMKIPLEIRLKRVKQRNVGIFGCRILKGGDMYEQEQDFYNFVASRIMDQAEAWLQRLDCPVICIDGRIAAADNA